MIRILIVEDEQMIRNGIERHMPWDMLGIEKVFTAENAEKGFQICLEEQPEIIISDINMPGMNGIELCSKYREIRPEGQIIFISGFSDKEYLLQAISMGALEYVEKPLSIEKLTEVVKKAVDKVNKATRYLEGNLHRYLLDGESSQKKWAEVLPGYEAEVTAGNHVVFRAFCIVWKKRPANEEKILQLIRETIDHLEDGRWYMVSDSMGRDKTAMIVYGHRHDVEKEDILRKTFLRMLQETDCSNQWFFGVGPMVHRPEELTLSYENAEKASTALSYMGFRQYATSEDAAVEYTSELDLTKENQFMKLLMEKNAEGAIAIVEEAKEVLLTHKAKITLEILSSFHRREKMISKAARQLQIEIGNITEKSVAEDIKTIQELTELLTNRIRSMFPTEGGDSRNVFAIQKVCDYMKEHYADKELSIKTLSDEVFLTPTYLSALFKKNMGVTIGQYLTEVRMEKASEFLKNPSLKLYHIAEMVGYDDPNYFGKIFKKHTGMLPSEYRNTYTK